MKAVIGWATPAMVASATALVALTGEHPGQVAKGISLGCGLAAVMAYASTVALWLSFNSRMFFGVWALSMVARFVFVGVTAWVILTHTQLNFVATMASLVGFSSAFLILESATCLKKG